MEDLVIKPKKKYKTVNRKNPITGNPIQYAVCPKGNEVTLDQLLDEMAKNGYGLGRLTGFKSVYIALLAVMKEHLAAGDWIYLDGFARVTSTVRGTVDESGQLAEGRNSVHTSIMALAGFRLSLKDFSWTNVSDTTTMPRLSSVHSCVPSAVLGKFVRGKDIRLNGRNLGGATTVVLSWTDEGETQSVTATPAEVEPTSVRLAWPAALAEVADGTEVTFTVSVGGGAEGTLPLTASRAAVLVEK